MNLPNESEYSITCRVAEYLQTLVDLKVIKCFSHVPQETFTKSWGVKMKNKRMGVNKGVPDMIVVGLEVVLFLELKKEKGGKVSPEQQFWVDSIGLKPAVVARIAKGYDQAISVISEYFPI